MSLPPPLPQPWGPPRRRDRTNLAEVRRLARRALRRHRRRALLRRCVDVVVIVVGSLVVGGAVGLGIFLLMGRVTG